MSQQPKSWQKKILAERSHADLYFYCEAKLPVAKRSSPLDPLADGYTPVGYPGRWIPVIPVAPNADGSRRIAEMLCHLFRLCIPDMQEVAPILTDVKMLKATGAIWYDWREDIPLDVTCAHCGAIERIAHTIAEDADKWLCADCVETGRWHAAYTEGGNVD